MRQFVCIFLLFFSTCFPLSIITNSGEFYSGQVIEENDSSMVLMNESGVVEINKEDIKEKIITLDSNNPFLAREYVNKKGLRFSFASGIGEQIPVNDIHTYSDGSTRNVFINQISEIGVFYYMDLPEKYSVEFGGGILNRLSNVGEKSSKDGFNCNFISLTVKRMFFRSLNGGYHFNLGMGVNLYSNGRMKAYDGAKDYRIKYKDAIGYHFIAESWSNMPRLWVFDNMNFVMSLRWNSGAIFTAESVEEVGFGPVTSPYNEWNNLGMNGFIFNTSIAFSW